MVASAPLVISTEAKRSGEISLLNSLRSIGAGDLSTQSIIGAFSICLPYRHAAPLEMTVAAGAAVVQKGCISFAQGAGRKGLMFKKP